MSTETVFANNAAWAAAIQKDQPDFFEKLAQGQDPDFLFIGCADSRVPAAQIMGLGPGDVFVHRNVANLVNHTDVNVQSVIEYAVAHLGVRHVVVCGHSGCGGVNAALSDADLGALNPWLRVIKDVYRAHQDELEKLDSADRAKRLIELNVEAQCLNVAKTTAVQAAWRDGEGPQIHGWVFHLDTGLIQDLEVDVDVQKGALQRAFGVA